MQCNIDARGQRVRRIWGGLNVIAAAALAVAGLLTTIWWLYVIAGACLLSGLFAFWEAKKKWCVVRALGIKTPM